MSINTFFIYVISFKYLDVMFYNIILGTIILLEFTLEMLFQTLLFLWQIILFRQLLIFLSWPLSYFVL